LILPGNNNNINVIFDDRSYRVSGNEIADTVDYILKEEGRRGAKVNVIFVDDPVIRKLNNEYFGKDRVTDVISFNFDDELLGEVYVSLPQARRQAREIDLTIKEEIQRLVVHGILHLLGYDHEKDDGRMLAKQEHYVRMVSGI
jgi:probable rRNA maturation factor